MVRNSRRLAFVRRFKRDVLGNCFLNKKLSIMKIFLFFFFRKAKKKRIWFFRIGPVDSPTYYRRKTKFCRYFFKRQHFRRFYDFIKIRQLRRVVFMSLKKKSSVHWFLYYMESRLDVILFRLHFFNSVKSARQFILHGNVLVNERMIEASSYNLKYGDVLMFLPNIAVHLKRIFFFKIKQKRFFLKNIPNYVESL